MTTLKDLRDKVLDLSVNLRNTLTSEELYLLHQFLEPLVRDAEYPRLLLGTGYEGARTLTCPHCQAVLTDEEGSEYTQLRVVDVAYRWTGVMVDTAGKPEVYANYDGNGEYESLVYECEVCDRPVSLPEGWTETS